MKAQIDKDKSRLMRKHYTLVLLTLLLCSVHIFAQKHEHCRPLDPKAGARTTNYEVSHLLLEVSFAPEEGKVMGKVTHTFHPLQKEIDTLFLDAPDITISKVMVDGGKADFKTNKKGVTILLPKKLAWGTEHTVTLDYTATPRKGLYFIGWNDANNKSRKQIWTQGQAIDNRYWIPSFDYMNDKLISELKIKFDAKYQVLSNGVLLSNKKQKDGTVLWHYKMPEEHSAYLIMLGIGDYAVSKTKSASGVNINNWYYPQFPERVEPTYRYSARMMDWMEKEFGVPYPWHEYSQIPVQDFMYGAMENTTATIFGDFYFVDSSQYLDRYYVGVNAHELVHQWFGDLITTRSPEHHWLHESFATHYAKQFQRDVFGEDDYRWECRKELNRTLSAAKKDSRPIVHTKAGSNRYYPKGSLVLDMFKYVVGREQFNKALANYLKEHSYKNVDTHDFYVAFLETLGYNLDWFFDQWLYRGGEPHYEVHYQSVTRQNGDQAGQFMVEQTHEMNDHIGLFKMPIVFDVHYTDGSKESKRVWIEEASQMVEIPIDLENKEVAFVLFDPNHEVIKTIDFTKDREMLIQQAMKAPNMIDRYDAVVALRKYKSTATEKALLQAYANEPFWGVRAEIVKQLINSNIISASQIKAFVTDPHQRVREAAADNITTISQENKALFEGLLNDASYNVISGVLKKLADQYPSELSRYLDITKNTQARGSHIEITRHKLGMSLDREKHLNALVDMTSGSYEFLTRGNAMRALRDENYLNDALIGHLFDAILNPNRRLAGPAKNVLKHFMAQKEKKVMVTTYYNKQNWLDWQSEILQPLF